MSRLLVTEAAVRAAVVDVARSRVGRHYGVGAVTPYGTWYGPGWERAYFCAAGWSWCWNQALGETDARRVIGYQTHGGVAPRQRGFIWTVAIITQHRARRVPLAQLKPGDAVMYRYNSGDNRQGNEVNHVDIVEVNRPDLGYVDCIGFNVPQPGAPAGTDPSRGGGNWRRRTWYNNPFVVAGLKMPAADLAERNRAAWSGVQRHYNTLELGKFEMTGVPGPATRAATADYARTYGYTGDQTDPLPLLTHLEDTMSTIRQDLADIKATLDAAKRERATIGDALATKIDARPSVKDFVDALMSRVLYGMPFHWWVRRGGILSRDHRHFPADPGSPADKELRAEALESGRATVYGPDGEAVQLELDPTTNRFQIKES